MPNYPSILGGGNFKVTKTTGIVASTAAGHGWNSGDITEVGYKALFADAGSGGGYSVQPVMEAVTGIGTSTVRVAGSAGNSGNNIYVWVLWIKDDATVIGP